MIKRILVAIDGSEQAWRALELGCDFAKQFDAKLVVFHAVTDPALPAELARYAEAEHLGGPSNFLFYSMIVDGLSEDARGRAAQQGIEDVVWRAQKGDPADTILSAARSEEADLIVMGRRGLSPVKAIFFGSVSQKVVQMAARPCVTTP